MFDSYEELVTIDEVCSMLNVGKNVAYRLLKEEDLHAFKIGRVWKIPKQSVIEYIGHKTKPYPTMITEAFIGKAKIR